MAFDGKKLSIQVALPEEKSYLRQVYDVKEKGGFMNGKTLYIPNEADVDHIVQNIRAELLEDGEISEDIVVLTALLNKSQDLQRYFSSYEKQALKKRLAEIKENPQNELIHKATEYIDTLFLMFIVAIS